jgi:hypothetical protein
MDNSRHPLSRWHSVQVGVERNTYVITVDTLGFLGKPGVQWYSAPVSYSRKKFYHFLCCLSPYIQKKACRLCPVSCIQTTGSGTSTRSRVRAHACRERTGRGSAHVDRDTQCTDACCRCTVCTDNTPAAHVATGSVHAHAHTCTRLLQCPILR